ARIFMSMQAVSVAEACAANRATEIPTNIASLLIVSPHSRVFFLDHSSSLGPAVPSLVPLPTVAHARLLDPTRSMRWSRFRERVWTISIQWKIFTQWQISCLMRKTALPALRWTPLLPRDSPHHHG